MATFYIEAIENTVLKLSKVGSPTVGTCKYGINNTSPSTSYTYGNSITLTPGDKCYFTITRTTTNFSTSNYLKFTSAGNINVGGNIADLLGGTDSIPRNYCFYYLFYGCTTLVDASNLVLCSNLNSKTYCYAYMFYRCTNLISPPEFQATTLTNYCYNAMFFGCTSLATPPVLPSTNLAERCYANMFRECTSLSYSPELPATVLAIGCYIMMFADCTTLANLPELKATTLSDACYGIMFSGCTSIKLSETQDGHYCIPYRIPSSGTGTVGTNSLNDMLAYTGGTFAGTPTINTTYYLWKDGEEVSCSIDPVGYGTVTGTSYYEEGETVTLTATPNIGKKFDGWYENDVLVSPNIVYTFTMGTSARSFVAKFSNKTWIAPIHDRSPQDLQNKTPKAYINAVDLNRIETDCEILSMSTLVSITYKNWDVGDIPKESDYIRIRNNVLNLIHWAYPNHYISEVATSYTYFNELELALQMLYDRIHSAVLSQPQCGYYCANEPNVLVAERN